MQAPKARAKILRYLTREQHMTSSFFKFQSGATAPGCHPLRAPMITALLVRGALADIIAGVVSTVKCQRSDL